MIKRKNEKRFVGRDTSKTNVLQQLQKQTVIDNIGVATNSVIALINIQRSIFLRQGTKIQLMEASAIRK